MKQLKGFLDQNYKRYNSVEFIEEDPISIPHRFDKKQDIEIIGFWTAMLSWGQRITIINKCSELVELMEGHPYEFVINLKPRDLKKFENFKHRTFNFIDTKHFLRFFNSYYRNHESLEDAFISKLDIEYSLEEGIKKFHHLFFSLNDSPERTRKHVSTPEKNSTCKRLNMFLRWMVREDGEVDFGLWKRISAKDLYCPLDVHIDRIARHFKLIERKQRDWQTVIELTENLKKIDPLDPVKYDIALFGLSVSGEYKL